MTVDCYGPGLATCLDCKAMWEPFDPAQIWDKDDPNCSFREPCNNCAFRTGSPEQADPAKWRELIDKLKCGGSFYCHKGVPIEPTSEHGFAYPVKTVDIGLPTTGAMPTIPDQSKLRLCRGYLNARVRLARAYDKESRSGKLDVLAIMGDPGP